jgi:hypothetical protein
VIHPLSRIPILGGLVDERFLDHRRRASSVAGIVTVILAVVFFEYRYFRYRVWDWDLVLVVLTFVVIKTALFAWYRFND